MLKWVAVAAALVLPATADAKVWVDVMCEHVVISTDGQFFNQEGPLPIVTCKIDDWPINRPNAKLACADGSEVNAEWPDDEKLIWNGRTLFVHDGPIPCGEEGAQWPD